MHLHRLLVLLSPILVLVGFFLHACVPRPSWQFSCSYWLHVWPKTWTPCCLLSHCPQQPCLALAVLLFTWANSVSHDIVLLSFHSTLSSQPLVFTLPTSFCLGSLGSHQTVSESRFSRKGSVKDICRHTVAIFVLRLHSWSHTSSTQLSSLLWQP